jgi:hypothetical protein
MDSRQGGDPPPWAWAVANNSSPKIMLRNATHGLGHGRIPSFWYSYQSSVRTSRPFHAPQLTHHP